MATLHGSFNGGRNQFILDQLKKEEDKFYSLKPTKQQKSKRMSPQDIKELAQFGLRQIETMRKDTANEKQKLLEAKKQF